MHREQFLSEKWRPYPPAGSGWRDVADFVANPAPDLMVGGRIGPKSGSEIWSLNSGGAEIRIRFRPKTEWLAPQDNETSFHPDLLRPNDLVCVRLGGRPGTMGEVHEADAVLLLAPALESEPETNAFSIERSRQWARFLGDVRGFFESRGFIEAQTPTLVPSPGTEPFLDPFRTSWRFGSSSRELFLPTSPEFHLKKMLARGWTRIFEIKSCFRNEELSEHHQPEFSMLEWYRAYADLDAIAGDVEALLIHLARKNGGGDPPVLKHVTMADLFADAFDGFRLHPRTTREELAGLAAQAGIAISASDSWDDVFFRLFLERLEPALGKNGPVLVGGYPPSQAALARIDERGWADRFEVYWKGLELANAFHELNHPLENERRFAKDAEGKRVLGKEPVPEDKALLKSMRFGMPPSGGIALGLDRLFMVLYGVDSIAETRAFPL